MNTTNKKLYINTKSGSARAEFTGRVGLPEPVITPFSLKNGTVKNYIKKYLL